MDSLEISNQKFQNIIENLPPKWRDHEKEGFHGHEKIKKENIGYYIFEVNRNEAYFYFGGCKVVHELLDVLIDSCYAESIEELYIGILNVSHGNYDYEESVKILSKGFFPNLKIFSIGSYDELYNGGMNFTGKLGDVTSLVKRMPKIEELELLGYFEFKQKMNFLHLKKLTLWSDSDTKGWFSEIPSDISQETLDNFLLSDLPQLNYLELFVDDDSLFQFPQIFLDAKTAPKLELMDIEGGFLVGEEEKLLKSALADSYNMTRIVSNKS
jgi:hypothetical protein